MQAATGIAAVEGSEAGDPGVLPAQALDHAAGYLLAAGVTTAVRRRIDGGHSWLAEVALARLAAELLQQRRARHVPKASASFTPTVATRGGITLAMAAATYDGGPESFGSDPVEWGSSEPEWLS